MGERRKRSGRAEPGVTSRTDGSLRSREADRALHRSAEKRPADWPAGLQSAAETCASLAHAALEQRDVAGARAQFEEGLRVLTPAGPKARWSYALGAGVSLCELDDGHGLDDALVAAVDFCQLALIYAPRDREPTLWAMAQTNLGRTLGLIGKRESGTARLEQAVAAFRAALEELTRDRGPDLWVMAQTNLGLALGALGERESGTARLGQAVVAFRAALRGRTREQVPLDWATAQDNLASALVRLGERESGTARLEQAVAAFRAALEERTRERMPLDWAGTQVKLGFALVALGRRESGTARLEQAVVAFRAALEELTEEGAIGWAVAQTNLGFTLLTLGERESGTVRLEEAMVVLDACLTSTAAVLPPELIEELRSGREKAQAEIACRSAR